MFKLFKNLKFSKIKKFQNIQYFPKFHFQKFHFKNFKIAKFLFNNFFSQFQDFSKFIFVPSWIFFKTENFPKMNKFFQKLKISELNFFQSWVFSKWIFFKAENFQSLKFKAEHFSKLLKNFQSWFFFIFSLFHSYINNST